MKNQLRMTLRQLLQTSPQRIAAFETAIVNISVAEGLPGAEGLDVSQCLATLESWAFAVYRFTGDCIEQYHQNPERFASQRGYFCFLSMVTLLKHPRGIGIAYQPTAIGNRCFRDSRDDLLHGLLTRKLGTCISLPTLFVAIGRRLGWPMHLAIAKGHVLCQWINGDGSWINLEGSCAGGGELLPAEHYHSWPRLLTHNELESGRYLRPLSRAEEFALFLETRGHCLTDNGRFDEAGEAYEWARHFAPHWSQYDAHMHILRLARDPAAYRLDSYGASTHSLSNFTIGTPAQSHSVDSHAR
jgi:hypothetical protein